MPKTPNEAVAAIAAILADTLNTTTTPTPLKWWREQSPDPSWPLATREKIAPGDINSDAEIKRRAAFGYRIDGVRVKSGLDLTLALALSDEIGKAGGPAEVDALVGGLGQQLEDVAVVLAICGGVVGGGLGGTPYTFAPRPFVSLRDVAAWQSGVVSPDQPGIGT
jgi:hypothetical protein